MKEYGRNRYHNMSGEKKQKLKGYQKNYRANKKLKKKTFDILAFHSIKMEQEALCFGENGIIKNAFLKNKKQININEVDIKRIVSSDEKSYGNKDSFKYFIGQKHKGNRFPAPLIINIYIYIYIYI